MSSDKTHWKKLMNPDYLGSWDVEGKDLILTIEKIYKGTVTGPHGKEDCTVCSFVEKGVKPMILNNTNQRTITHLYHTPYIEDWPGKKIQIYVDQVKVKGEIVDALRIRPMIPKTEKPKLVSDTPTFDNVKKFLSEGGSIKDVEKKYIVTPEILELLNAK